MESKIEMKDIEQALEEIKQLSLKVIAQTEDLKEKLKNGPFDTKQRHPSGRKPPVQNNAGVRL